MTVALERTGFKSIEPPFEENAEGARAPSAPHVASAGLGGAQWNHPSRIALIDPRPLTRLSLSQLLEGGASAECRSHGFVVSPFADCNELLANAVECSNIRLIVFHIGGSHIYEDAIGDSLQRIKQHLPAIPLILLSDHEEPLGVIEALRRGVHGYITTTLDFSLTIQALHLVQAGGIFIPCSTLLQVLDKKTAIEKTDVGGVDAAMALQDFTPRQRQVLQLLRQGKSNKVIAHEFDLQESTVKVHVRDIMKKLGATNRTHAAFLALKLLEVAQGLDL